MTTVERGLETEQFWTPTSSRSFEELAKIFSLPEKVEKQSFLDIGGGGSNFTATLLEKGADAYTVDQLYSQSEKEFERKLEANIKFLTEEKKQPDSQGKHKPAYEHFFRSRKANPDRYIATQATKLPFPDKHFDFVISHKCIIPYLDFNKELFFDAMDEAIRVTKEGGLIQIYPFFDPPESSGFSNPAFIKEGEKIYESRQENQRELVKKVAGNHRFEVSVESAGDGKSKLVIFINSENMIRQKQYQDFLNRRYGDYT